jgi:coenzyme F420-reducing hydrogenase alpha subunit
MSEKIELNHVTKIEGHASLSVEIVHGKVKKCDLVSVEGARFFEGIVEGRHYDEIKEITSRICGICSVSHSMTSLRAMEKALGMKVSKQTKLLRELMSMGERIRSHATHLYFLVLPDYLGYESAIAMASKYKNEVADAMELIKLGNEIVIKTSGRQMHPVASVIGGFTYIPTEEDVKLLKELMKGAREKAVKTLKLFLKLKYPVLENNNEHVSLKHSNQPILEGDIVSDKGFVTKEDEYTKYIQEHIHQGSTSKFAVKEGKEYMVGALPRLNNNLSKFDKELVAMAEKAGFKFPSKNPFWNNVAQALELVYWIDQAQEALKYKFKEEKIPEIKIKAGRGIAATEAPRGILYHDYTINDQGYVTKCNIITPTCQNLSNMQIDIKKYLQELLNKKKSQKKIILEIEKLIRAYDPCFSCSTHFLKVDWKES